MNHLSENKLPIRLLILHAQANNDDCGGSFQMLKHFLKGVDHSVFDIYCLLSLLDKSKGDPNSGGWQILESLGVKVHVQYVPVNQAGSSPMVLVKYFFEVIGATLRVRRFIRQNEIDLVYTNTINMLPGGLAAKMAGVHPVGRSSNGVKSVYHIHEIVRRPPVVAKILARIVGKLADKLLCVSKAAMQPFREVGVAEAKLVHVPNCIDLTVFDDSRDGQHIRAAFLKNEHEKLVVAVGRLVPKKGFHDLIEAAKDVVERIPDCRFLFVGDTKNLSAKPQNSHDEERSQTVIAIPSSREKQSPQSSQEIASSKTPFENRPALSLRGTKQSPAHEQEIASSKTPRNDISVKTGDAYKQKLLSRIDELGLQEHIIFAGPRSDIPEIMAAADAAVLISASDATPESFGLVILEALAMGTPVVATAMGGIPELLQGGEHGELVPPHDPPALAAGLLRLLQDARKAREMGEAGRQWVRQEFSGEDYAGKVQGILVDLSFKIAQIENNFEIKDKSHRIADNRY